MVLTDFDTSDSLVMTVLVDNNPKPSWITQDSSNVITFAPNSNSLKGSYQIKVTVTDDNSINGPNGVLSHSCTYYLTVNQVDNTAPAIDSGCVNIAMDAFSSDSRTIAFSDADSTDSLSMSVLIDASTIPSWVTVNSSNKITFSPYSNDLVGIHTVDITVQDNNSIGGANGPLQATCRFEVEVIYFNRCPELAKLPEQGITLKQTETKTLEDYCVNTDLDLRDTVTCTLNFLTTGNDCATESMCNVNGNSFNISPTLLDTVRTYRLQIELDDSTCTKTYDFDITVEDAENYAPAWNLPFASVSCNIDLENGADFTEDLSDDVTDQNIDEGFNDQFSFSIDNVLPVSCIRIVGSELICDCSDNSEAGSYTATLRVEDNNAIGALNGI